MPASGAPWWSSASATASSLPPTRCCWRWSRPGAVGRWAEPAAGGRVAETAAVGRVASTGRIRRLLIANRGEIAARVVRTCARLGIESVLAASDADLDALPARLADRTVRLGPSPASACYLDPAAVIRAARSVAADAVHPGYGFLSENPALARACAENGIIFVGPTAESLDAVGDKLRARSHALDAGLPVVPGGEAADLAGAQQVATEDRKSVV